MERIPNKVNKITAVVGTGMIANVPSLNRFEVSQNISGRKPGRLIAANEPSTWPEFLEHARREKTSGGEQPDLPRDA